MYERKRGALVAVIFNPDAPTTSETPSYYSLALFVFLLLGTGLFLLALGLGFVH